jgi:MoaA/NifB/PqqE/SkfB family radical SAM enzyme
MFNPDMITITGGGEPLLKSDLVVSMTSIIKKHPSIRGEIITNGTLFNEKIVKYLISLKWDLVSISINSSNKDLDDFIRRKKGAYEKTMEGIKLFNEQKEKLNSPFPHLKFNVVITKYNFLDIQNMVKLAAKYKGSIQIRLVNEQPDSGKPLCLSPKKYNDFTRNIKKAEKLAISKGVDFYKDFTERDVKYYLNLEKGKDIKSIISSRHLDKKQILKAIKDDKINKVISEVAVCSFPFTEINIFANGYASPCGGFFAGLPEGYVESDLKVIESVNKKSLKNIWYGEKFNYMRALMLLHRFPRACLACNVNFINVSRIFRDFFIKKCSSQF